MRNFTICQIHITFIVVLIIQNASFWNCNSGMDSEWNEWNEFWNGSCDFDTVDSDGNNHISFEELIRFISRNSDLDKETLVEAMLQHGKIFYQNDFNDDGQLSRFEWERGREVISVLGRLTLAIIKLGSSAFDEYVSSYLDIRTSCDLICSSNDKCDRNICEQNCTVFEFDYEEVIGSRAIEDIFLRMNDDVKEEIGGSNGILIKEKLVNSHERYDPKVFKIIDLNHDGRLDDKEALDVLHDIRTKLFAAIKQKCDIWFDEYRESLTLQDKSSS